jgi:XisH protein
VPVADTIYNAVKNALIKDGWTITHDPYTVKYGSVRVHADLAAEKILAAEKGTERIAVEIKSFVGPSPIHDFEEALGQFMLYLALLRRVDPNRKLYLAVSQDTHDTVFTREGIQAALDDFAVARLIVSVSDEEVIAWIG